MQERVRNLERELDWVRGEREEEQTAVAHERRETAGRLRELEAASNRLKSARKDDLKRVSREKAQALDRCKVRAIPRLLSCLEPFPNLPTTFPEIASVLVDTFNFKSVWFLASHSLLQWVQAGDSG